MMIPRWRLTLPGVVGPTAARLPAGQVKQDNPFVHGGYDDLVNVTEARCWARQRVLTGKDLIWIRSVRELRPLLDVAVARQTGAPLGFDRPIGCASGVCPTPSRQPKGAGDRASAYK